MQQKHTPKIGKAKGQAHFLIRAISSSSTTGFLVGGSAECKPKGHCCWLST